MYRLNLLFHFHLLLVGRAIRPLALFAGRPAGGPVEEPKRQRERKKEVDLGGEIQSLLV